MSKKVYTFLLTVHNSVQVAVLADNPEEAKYILDENWEEACNQLDPDEADWDHELLNEYPEEECTSDTFLWDNVFHPDFGTITIFKEEENE